MNHRLNISHNELCGSATENMQMTIVFFAFWCFKEYKLEFKENLN